MQKTVRTRTRLINFIIDLIVIVLLMSLVILYFLKTKDEKFVDETVTRLIAISVIFTYYFFMEISFGRTVGKFITKTRVVTVDDQEPGSKEMILRTAIRFVPIFDAISFLHTEKTGLHDRWSGTKLVKI